MDKSKLGDRMKGYESLSETKLMAGVPIVVRLDGRAFSNFTKGLKKPFDKNFQKAMIETTKYLVKNTGAIIGYTQSDEISLILMSDNSSDLIFGARVQKIASNFASMASSKFLLESLKYFPDKINEDSMLPSFDCRLFNVPNKTEAVNAILWRVKDAYKNSISMVAHYHFTHKSLLNLNGEEMKKKLLLEKGVDYDLLPVSDKQGVFVKKVRQKKKLSKERLDKIPVNKRPLDGVVERSFVKELESVDFLKMENKNFFIFRDQEPIYADGIYEKTIPEINCS